MTQRGLQLLQAADVVLHDRLVPPAILDYARRDAQLISVGKSPDGPSTEQEFINRKLVGLVAAGYRVCRLKGGDPFVFGRGAEELAALAAAGFPYEVVPGITAANGCAAAAGVPLTCRARSSAVTLATAHRARDEDPDWSLLARGSHTLVIYMGVARLAEISSDLVRLGRSPQTPAALVENGTTDRQRIVGGQLCDIAARAAAEKIRSPALLLIGDVVDVADKIGWMTGAETGRASEAIASH